MARSDWVRESGTFQVRSTPTPAHGGGHSGGPSKGLQYIVAYDYSSARLKWKGGPSKNFVLYLEQSLDRYFERRDGAQTDLRFRRRGNTYYRLRCRDVAHGDNKYYLYRYIDGASTLLAQNKYGPSSSRDWESVRLTVTDGRVHLQFWTSGAWDTVWDVSDASAILHDGDFTISVADGAAIGSIDLTLLED